MYIFFMRSAHFSHLLFHLITLIFVDWYKLWSSSSRNFLQPSVTLSLLRLLILPNTLLPITVNLSSFHRDSVSYMWQWHAKITF
jgi:hypothetical protein